MNRIHPINNMFIYRKLGNVVYNIIENEENINPCLTKWLGREWRIDNEEHPDQVWTKEWLTQLPNMNFKLAIVDIGEIRPRKELMNYKKGGHSFRDELKERVRERQESILRGISIEPLVVRHSDMELMDGYTRYFVLKKLDEKKVYAYVGNARAILTLKPNSLSPSLSIKNTCTHRILNSNKHS